MSWAEAYVRVFAYILKASLVVEGEVGITLRQTAARGMFIVKCTGCPGSQTYEHHF